jgi:succinylglutamic semialdehyde dehydrogenase
VAERDPFEARGDLIAGELRPPESPTGEIPLEEPGDISHLAGTFPFHHDAVERAVRAARRAWPAWRDAGRDARAECLRRLGAQIESDAAPLAELIAREVGKPIWEARTEVAALRAKIDITLADGLALVAETSFEMGAGRVARWRSHARGVLAVLGPFNFPAHLPHGHVVPALATGNTVVFKPSDKTPAVGQRYAELLLAAGFPAGVVNVIQGDGSVGAALAAHDDVDGVLFTGSFAVGQRIREATLSQPWKLLALEMGGKNGVLVCEDADLDAAAEAIAYGACITTGQRCSATSRVLVERGAAAPMLERLRWLLPEIRHGAPLDESVFMGPLCDGSARRRHAELSLLARAEGAECLVPGGPCEGPRPGHYVRPSLHRVRRLDRGSRYQMEEHFVPDVAVLEVGDLAEAIAALEATPYGLVASVFTRERERFERVYRETRLGLLNWNTSTVGANSRLPFGGVKRSGNGRAAGVASTLYTTYPVACVEFPEPVAEAHWPGFPERR